VLWCRYFTCHQFVHCETAVCLLILLCGWICQLYKGMSQACLPCCSGDAGVGLNVRRLTKQFTSTFTTSYSLRPVADVGSVFRRYPGQWQVFVEDPSMEPGRYLLAAERPTRPAGTACHQCLFCRLACHVYVQRGTSLKTVRVCQCNCWVFQSCA